MNVEVSIDKDAINKMVANAILESVLGDTLKKAMERSLQSLSSGYENQLDKLVKEQIQLVIRDVLQTEYRELLRDEVSKVLADKVTDGFITNLLLQAADFK